MTTKINSNNNKNSPNNNKTSLNDNNKSNKKPLFFNLQKKPKQNKNLIRIHGILMNYCIS